MVTCKFPKVVTKSGVGDGDVGYDVTGVSADHNVQRMAHGSVRVHVVVGRTL